MVKRKPELPLLLDEQIDTGNILLQKSVPIGETETAGELHDRLNVSGAGLVVETICMLTAGNINPIPQNQIKISERVNQPLKIFKETCRVDWNNPSQKFSTTLGGLAHTLLHGLNLKPKETMLKQLYL